MCSCAWEWSVTDCPQRSPSAVDLGLAAAIAATSRGDAAALLPPPAGAMLLAGSRRAREDPCSRVALPT
eukprot:9090043-Pyramimonas_sp.AAC.1